MKKQFAVIGLGSFGQSVGEELMRLGHEVLGIESDEATANRLADTLTHTVIADATDEHVLRELRLERYDAVLVAIGEHIEASILCTMTLKSLNVNQVWVKAITQSHHRIVEKIGADRIIHPEFEMGLRVAQSLTYPKMLDYIALGDDYFVVELRPGEDFEGKTLGDLKLGEKFKVRLLAIKHGAQVRFDPPHGYEFRRNDHMILLGELSELRRFSEVL